MTASILDGIVLGLQFGLLATGLTLMYGLGGILNLAYGQMAVISAIVTVSVMDAGLPVVPAALVGMATGAVLGWILDQTVFRPLYSLRGEARVLLSLLLSLGVALMIDGFLNWLFPLKGLSLFIGGGAIDIFGEPMRRGSLLASAITIVAMAALVAFFRFTTLGRAVRSVIEDEEGARLVGIDPRKMLRLILVLSGAIAALVALTRSMVAPVDVTAGFGITVFALIVTVVGGLGSITGALAAGIILGIINAIAASAIGTFMSLIILLVAAAITILVRPAGLLGVKE